MLKDEIKIFFIEVRKSLTKSFALFEIHFLNSLKNMFDTKDMVLFKSVPLRHFRVWIGLKDGWEKVAQAFHPFTE